MPVLLDLPDELLCAILRTFRTASSVGYEKDWAAAQCFMQLCKRLHTATRLEPWTAGWELLSEGMKRLDEHKDFPNIVSRIRDLRIPAVHNISKHPAVKTGEYDRALATTIGRFERLANVEIIFHDWDHNWETTGWDGLEERLNLQRGLPYCLQALEAICAFSSTITSLSFEGIRSPEDQGLVLSILQRNRQIRKLEVAYRMDWAVLVILREEADCIQSKNLWRLLASMEKLQVLRMTCLPARDIGPDSDWTPDVWLPSLRRFDFCRVHISLGLLQAILEKSDQCHSLSLDEHIIPMLSEAGQPSFSRLTSLTLAGAGADATLEALGCFKKAHLRKLDISIPSDTSLFLMKYLEHEIRSRTLDVLTAIVSPQVTLEDLEDMRLRFEGQYRKAHIDLRFKRIELEPVA